MGVDSLTPAVFLDRDGVINAMWYDAEHGTVDSPSNPSQFRLLAGAAAAIARLNAVHLPVIVVSNQPGIAKGKLVPTLLDQITARMHELLAAEGAHVDAVYYCLHHPDAHVREYHATCDCRKPRP